MKRGSVACRQRLREYRCRGCDSFGRIWSAISSRGCRFLSFPRRGPPDRKFGKRAPISGNGRRNRKYRRAILFFFPFLSTTFREAPEYSRRCNFRVNKSGNDTPAIVRVESPRRVEISIRGKHWRNRTRIPRLKIFDSRFMPRSFRSQRRSIKISVRRIVRNGAGESRKIGKFSLYSASIMRFNLAKKISLITQSTDRDFIDNVTYLRANTFRFLSCIDPPYLSYFSRLFHGS